jgi:uncharacterized protein (TIGR02001 family)
MRRILQRSILVVSLAPAPGWAADLRVPPPAPTTPASPWELAVNVTGVTDYNFRGISQSDRGPSAWALGELRYDLGKTLQLYAGVAAESIEFPNRARAEVDFFAGVRPKFGALTLDLGVWYYEYPNGTTFNGTPPSVATCANGFVTPTGFCNVVKAKLSYFEVFGKATYALSDQVSLGANVFHAGNWLNAGTPGTYASLTAKVSAPSSWTPPDWGIYVAGELGRYWFNTTDPFYGVPAFPNGVEYPDYTHWNIGGGVTYKAVTFDLRYYDTTLSRIECNIITSDHTAVFNPGAVTVANPSGLTSRWCGAAVIGKLSVDISSR